MRSPGLGSTCCDVSLTEILQREFAALSPLEGGRKGVRKDSDQARLLGISPSLLSRLKSGKARLTHEKAEAISRVLRKGCPAHQQRELLEELLRETRDTEEDNLASQVTAFFRQFASRTAPLLVVDYRDHPRADEQGAYAGLAKVAGEAVARGLSMAMMQCFGVTFESDEQTANLRRYVETLRDRVRNAYTSIRAAAMERTSEAEVDRRLVLYERLGNPSLVGAGIQSRLFYTEFRRESEQSPIEREIWEWVAAPDKKDVFKERDTEESIVLLAYREQFTPITNHWTRYGRLPTEAHDLAGEWKIFSPKTASPEHRRGKRG